MPRTSCEVLCHRPLIIKSSEITDKKEWSTPISKRNPLSEYWPRLRRAHASLVGLLFFLAASLDCFAGSAQIRQLCLAKVLEQLNLVVDAPRFDTPIELELTRDPKVMKILTTTDGTLRPLLGDLPVPDFLREWQNRKKELEGVDPKAIAWDAIPNSVRLKLLRYVSATSDYRVDRALPGMRVRPTLRLKFEKDTVFLGKKYRAGKTYRVDVSEVLGGEVHYKTRSAVARVTGVEIHFRGDQSAGQMSQQAAVLLDALGIERSGQHAHVLAQVPVEALRADPENQTLYAADFLRMSNFMAEAFSVLRGSPLSKVPSRIPGTVLFNYLRQAQFGKIIASISNTARTGQPFKLEHSLRMAAVGLRDSTTYDQPGLWGLEFRAIGASEDLESYGRFLDAVQAMFNDKDFGLSAARSDRLRRWQQARNAEGKSIKTAMTESLYNRNLGQQGFAGLPSRTQAIFGTQERWQQFVKTSDSRNDIKMLVYDWSRDPLTFEDPKLVEKISRAQDESLRSYLAGEKPQTVMKEFIANSGVFDAMLGYFSVSGSIY